MDLIWFVMCLVYLWFDTDAFIEYAKLLRLRFAKYEEYEQMKSTIPSMEYVNFLLMKYNNFFTRLISCPVCVIVWLNLIQFLLYKNFSLSGHIILSWIGYFGLRKVLQYFKD